MGISCCKSKRRKNGEDNIRIAKFGKFRPDSKSTVSCIGSKSSERVDLSKVKSESKSDDKKFWKLRRTIKNSSKVDTPTSEELSMTVVDEKLELPSTKAIDQDKKISGSIQSIPVTKIGNQDITDNTKITDKFQSSAKLREGVDLSELKSTKIISKKFCMGFVFSPRSFMKKNEIIDGQNKKRRSYLKYFLKKSTNVTLYHDNQLTGTDKVIKKEENELEDEINSLINEIDQNIDVTKITIKNQGNDSKNRSKFEPDGLGRDSHKKDAAKHRPRDYVEIEHISLETFWQINAIGLNNRVKSIIKSVTAENLEESTEQLTTYIVSLTNLEETINFMMKMAVIYPEKLACYKYMCKKIPLRLRYAKGTNALSSFRKSFLNRYQKLLQSADKQQTKFVYRRVVQQ